MNKKYLLLLAAPLMLAACSSDDVNEVNGGTTPPVSGGDTQYVSGGTVEYSNGMSMNVGAVDADGNPVTRATTNTINFSICLDDVLSGMGVDKYIILADDFAVRKDGEYQENIKATQCSNGGYKNTIQLDNIEFTTVKGSSELSGWPFLVNLNGLNNLDFGEYNEKTKSYETNNYEFDVMIWVENKKLLDDGTGGYGELFDDAKKFAWIGVSNQKSTYAYWLKSNPGSETGLDFSCYLFTAKSNSQVKYSKNNEQKSLVVKYNVYRGLSGNNGDTPYIRVSISVEKQAPTTIGDGTTYGERANDYTFVDYGSTNIYKQASAKRQIARKWPSSTVL